MDLHLTFPIRMMDVPESARATTCVPAIISWMCIRWLAAGGRGAMLKWLIRVESLRPTQTYQRTSPSTFHSRHKHSAGFGFSTLNLTAEILCTKLRQLRRPPRSWSDKHTAVPPIPDERKAGPHCTRPDNAFHLLCVETSFEILSAGARLLDWIWRSFGAFLLLTRLKRETFEAECYRGGVFYFI